MIGFVVLGRPTVLAGRSLLCQRLTVRASRTTTQPLRVCHVVSSTRVPGTYRRPAGAIRFAAPTLKRPAPRSRIAPNTLGLSGRGRHNPFPLGDTRAISVHDDRKAYWPICGKAETGDGSSSGCVSAGRRAKIPERDSLWLPTTSTGSDLWRRSECEVKDQRYSCRDDHSDCERQRPHSPSVNMASST